MVFTSFFAEKFLSFFGGLCCLSLRLCFLFVVSCPTMSSSFAKIRRKNSSFYAGDIHLDPFETIRVIGEAEGVKDGLDLRFPGKKPGLPIIGGGMVKLRRVIFM